MATKQDEVFGEPLHNDSGKFWHVSPSAGQRPAWVDAHLGEGSEYYWDLYYNRAEIDAAQLWDILLDKGWITE